ncbi:MAG: hypothetical protein RL632_2060 [Bacteroidota bacterium]|jgi:hypothetical protein
MKKQLLILTTVLFCTSAFAQIPNYVPTNGLVGWWPFNGNANDESGNGNNGTVNGATLTADRFGVLNKAYYFNGNSNILSNGQLTSVTSTITVSIWVKSEDNSGEWNGLITTQSNNQQGFLLQENQNGLYDWSVSNGAGYYDIYSSSVITNQWKFIVCEIQPTSMKIFINGVLENSTTIASNSLYSNAQLCFGSRYPIEYFKGTLDDIGIWNRVLTSCEIADLYHAQLGYNNTTSSQTQTALDSYTWSVNGQTYTQSGTYSDTLVNAAGCDSIVTLNLSMSYTGIEEMQPNSSKKLLRITDLSGKETPFRKNTVLLFIYEDGTVERVYVTE